MRNLNRQDLLVISANCRQRVPERAVAPGTSSTHPNIHPTMKMFQFLETPLIAFFVFTLLAPAIARAEEASPSSAKATSRIDPQALEVLRRMSTTLGAAKAFTYRSRSIVEVPAKTGQFITLFSAAEVALKRPDKLRARLTGEAPHFDFYFDGTAASAFAPATKVYSTVEAPPTIDTMLPAMQQETGIRFPSAPLLFSDPYGVLTRNLISGIVIGPSVVNGHPCQHLAFRSPGVNWEIWVESGKRALPWRLAVTFTDRTNFPRVLVEFLNWNLNPWLKAGDFAFRRPAGAREIPFLSVIKPKAR
jgi:hypothetical protein